MCVLRRLRAACVWNKCVKNVRMCAVEVLCDTCAHAGLSVATLLDDIRRNLCWNKKGKQTFCSKYYK